MLQDCREQEYTQTVSVKCIYYALPVLFVFVSGAGKGCGISGDCRKEGHHQAELHTASGRRKRNGWHLSQLLGINYAGILLYHASDVFYNCLIGMVLLIVGADE